WVEDASSDWFEKRLPAIAREHGFNIVASNRTSDLPDPAPQWHGHGQSRIIRADGRILSALDPGRGRCGRRRTAIPRLRLRGSAMTSGSAFGRSGQRHDPLQRGCYNSPVPVLAYP